MPLISVIIPSYNHANFLFKRIDSILNQTIQDFEVIILDDYSTDNSRDIIEGYKNHPKVTHIIYNETNSGSPFKQWKKGLDLAKGDIIWIAESDDYADEMFLEKLLPCFELDTEIGVVYSDSHVIDEQNNFRPNFCKFLKNEYFTTNKWSSNYKASGSQEIKENLYFECTINNMSATLFKKKLVPFINFERLLQFEYSGDWFFLVGLVKQCKIYYVSEALNYFKHGTNNFKADVRTSFTYFKETSLIRYYYWHEVSLFLPLKTQKELLNKLGAQMQVAINEFIKGKIKAIVFWKGIKALMNLSPKLFAKQLQYSCLHYFRKRN